MTHGSLYQSFGFPVLLHQAGNEGWPLTFTPARQYRGPPASAIWNQYYHWAYLLEAQFSAFKRILLYLLSTSLEKEFQSLSIPYPIPKSAGSRKQPVLRLDLGYREDPQYTLLRSSPRSTGFNSPSPPCRGSGPVTSTAPSGRIRSSCNGYMLYYLEQAYLQRGLYNKITLDRARCHCLTLAEDY